MIVTIAAWLYLLDAVLLISSLLLTPWSSSGIENLVTLAIAGLLGAMGIGLLKRLTWARWLALGSSLLGWVLGSLLLLIVLGYLFIAAPAALFLAVLFCKGLLSSAGLFALLLLVTYIASVVVSYKLFWYLCSMDGCAEFGVPHGSTQAVVASSGAWIAIFIVNLMLAWNELSTVGLGVDRETSAGSTPASAAGARPLEEPDYAVRRARGEAMLREQAEREAARAMGVEEPADEPEVVEAEPAEDQMIDESPVPAPVTLPDTADEGEEETPTRILKCVDTAGGTIFTQGYCPPGSKPARAPSP